MVRDFDLLGDPIPEGRGKPGATGHIPTAERVNKVRLLVVARWTSQQIAAEIGVSVPTLNRHYFRNGSIKRAREVVIAEARGRVFLQLDRAAEAGSVSAMKELGKLVLAEELRGMASDIRKPKAVDKLGKKEQRKRDSGPDGSWSFLGNAPKSDEVH